MPFSGWKRAREAGGRALPPKGNPVHQPQVETALKDIPVSETIVTVSWSGRRELLPSIPCPLLRRVRLLPCWSAYALDIPATRSISRLPARDEFQQRGSMAPHDSIPQHIFFECPVPGHTRNVLGSLCPSRRWRVTTHSRLRHHHHDHHHGLSSLFRCRLFDPHGPSRRPRHSFLSLTRPPSCSCQQFPRSLPPIQPVGRPSQPRVIGSSIRFQWSGSRGEDGNS